MTLDQFISNNPGKSAEELLALASVPTYTPRTDRITVTTLVAILGGAAGITIYNTLLALQGNDNPAVAGFARVAVAVLNGPGFDPANAEAATVAATLVTAGAATSEQVQTIFNTVSYPCGSIPTLEEVQVGIARVTRAAAFESLRSQAYAPWVEANDLWNARAAKIDRLATGDGEVPADLAALDAVN